MVVLSQHYQRLDLPAPHPCRLFPYNYPVVMLYATGYTVKFMDCSCRLIIYYNACYISAKRNKICTHCGFANLSIAHSVYDIHYVMYIFTPDPQVTSVLDLLKEDRATPIRLIFLIYKCIDFNNV
jgi:hypothetical protein